MRKFIIKNSLTVIAVLFLSATSLMAKDPGLNAFIKGDYKESADYYDARMKKDQDNDKIRYNRGSVALAEKDLETAESLLKQSLASENPAQLSKAYYNLGQIDLEQQETDKALENFKKSMLQDPDNSDAKIMYEHVQYMKQEQQEQQDQESEDKNQDQKDGQDQENKDQDSKDKQDQEKEQDGEQNQSEDQQEDQAQQQESQLSQEDLTGEELSKEQAKNILNAMKEDEKESMKKLILSKARSKKVKRSKEW